MSTTTTAILEPPRFEHYANQDGGEILYKFSYELWKRSGGYKPAITNLRGLTASVAELNTLDGIHTDDTVQQQIDLKANSADLGTMADQDKDSVDISGGIITGTTLSGNDITILAGGSSVDIELGGTLVSDIVAAQNIGAGEDTLMTYTVAGNSLNATGDYLEIEAWGTVAANANNKTIKLKFGTTTLLTTGAVAANSGSWWISARIARRTDSLQTIITKIISDNTLIIDSATYTAGAEDTTGDLAVFCTGEGTADGDIIQNGLIVKWFKA